MNISPILLLAIGATFAFLYGMIITIGWAITRKNRKAYHKSVGYSEVGLFSLENFKPLGGSVQTVSFQNNRFLSGNDTPVDLNNYDCYMVEVPSQDYPKIEKGDLILIEPSSNKIKYAFKVPDLKGLR